MKTFSRLLAPTLLCALSFGCARFTTKQTDVSVTDKYGTETRTITTKAQATTFFDSGSKLANFKATQTDKTQGASVGSLDQNSSSTNAANIVGAVVEAAIRAAK